jgi:hypothetical protein
MQVIYSRSAGIYRLLIVQLSATQVCWFIIPAGVDFSPEVIIMQDCNPDPDTAIRTGEDALSLYNK